MDIGGIIAISVIFGVPLLIGLFNAFANMFSQPYQAKKELLEKQEKKENEALTEKQKKLDNLIEDSSELIKYACNEERERLNKETEICKSKQNELDNQISLYKAKNIELEKEKKKLQIDFEKEREEVRLAVEKEIKEQYYNDLRNLLFKLYDIEGMYKSIETGRLKKAYDSELAIENIAVNVKMKSDENYYNTSLSSCSCMDFQKRHLPCKHMLYLAVYVGTLQAFPRMFRNLKDNTFNDMSELIEQKTIIEHETNFEKENLEKIKQQKTRTIKELENLIKKKCQAYPQLAGVMADLITYNYEKSAQYLENKRNPAFLEAQRIKELRAETKAILKREKILEYKMAYIQELFPNINDIFEEGFQETEFELETEETTDKVRLFVSNEEYHKLTVTERNQLALDNYIASRKSKWQVGRDYEMYIGHLLQGEGYKVKYTGIIEKLEDMGRDLIATKENEVLIVQCKNWSQEKTIHEKHIFQLYGTVVMFSLGSKKKIKGAFVTTTKLSETAKKVAQHLGIEVVENKPLGDFPRIKCNINRETGEKIYHLPFDQQYDKVVIDSNKGEMCCLTVKEAENSGFRRAFKHYSNNT